MYMHGIGMRGNPWYRGYMPRSYLAPTFIASFGCASCLIVFGIFLTLGGVMITVFANIDLSSKSSHFDDPFFKRHKQDDDPFSIFAALRIVGPVFIATGLLLLASSIGICCFARHSMMKQEKKRKSQQEQPMVPPHAGSYPQQPSPAQYGAAQQYPSSQYPAPSQYPSGLQYPPGQYPAAQQYTGVPLYPPGSVYPAPQYPPQQPYQQGYPLQDNTFESSKSSQPPPPGFNES